MSPSDLGDIDSDEFREHGHAVVEWIATYLEGIEDRPVLSRAAPGQVRGARAGARRHPRRAAIPDAPPDEAESLAGILADIDRAVMDGITHWNHPGFLAYFAVTASGPGILGEMLAAAAVNANGTRWKHRRPSRKSRRRLTASPRASRPTVASS